MADDHSEVSRNDKIHISFLCDLIWLIRNGNGIFEEFLIPWRFFWVADFPWKNDSFFPGEGVLVFGRFLELSSLVVENTSGKWVLESLGNLKKLHFFKKHHLVNQKQLHFFQTHHLVKAVDNVVREECKMHGEKYREIGRKAMKKCETRPKITENAQKCRGF